MKNIGCPTWGDVHPVPRNALIQTLHVWSAVYDCGPDVFAGRKHVHVQVADTPNALFWDFDCLMHQAQLGVRSGLVRADVWIKRLGDQWKYFSLLAKLSNVWREHCRGVFLAWVRIHGPILALKHGKAAMCKCIAGRWGSVYSVQQRFLDAGQAQIVPVLAEALKSRTMFPELAIADADKGQEAIVMDGVKVCDGRGPGELVGDGADTKIDQLKVYSAKMGRWSREALGGARSCLFWILLEIMHISQGPLQQLLAFIQKPIPSRNIPSQGNHLAQLVCGKGEEMWHEYNKLLLETQWPTLLDKASICHSQAHSRAMAYRRIVS